MTMPTLRTYRTLKTQYPQHLLLLQVGAFYECYSDDAIKIAAVCDLPLIEDASGKTVRFARSFASEYIGRLIDAGVIVAVADLATQKEAAGDDVITLRSEAE